jgi:monoamine oxidase
VTKDRIAIVGGGIAGLYAAWRLKALRQGDVRVYEAAERVGGRILTAEFGVFQKENEGSLTRLKAELGAMRFPNQHKLLLALCTELDIPDVDKTRKPAAWRAPFQLKSLFHLRGKILSKESFQREDIPYRVRAEERGKAPDELLEYAIFRMLQRMIDDFARKGVAQGSERVIFLKEFRKRLMDHEVVTAYDWVTFANHNYDFAGIPLRNIGFWNVLKHFLSSEAFLLVHDGFGFLSVISNWNAPEAFKWLLTDFSPHLRLQTVPGGLSKIVNELERRLGKGELGRDVVGDIINKNHTVREIHCDRSQGEDEFRLRFEESKDFVVADRLILALPPSALGRIRFFEDGQELCGDVERDWRKLVHCSRPHRLAKIVLAYEEPWWQHTGVPGAESGRLFTDLPMRQIHYFGPTWLAENGWVSGRPSKVSLVMVYNDSHYEAFWRTFHVHNNVYRSTSDGMTDARNTLGLKPEEIAGGSFRFLGPRKFGEISEAQTHGGIAKAPISNGDLVELSEREEFDEYEVRHRMEEKVRDQLTELHNYEVPMAIGGVYRDWSHDGGWHTWEPFVDVGAIKEVIVQPFYRDMNQRVRLRSCTRDEKSRLPVDELPRLPLYVCGEAYAWEQGWIEGALMTAERVAAIVSGRSEKPEKFLPDQDSFDKYMYAESAAEVQDRLRPLFELREKCRVANEK